MFFIFKYRLFLNNKGEKNEISGACSMYDGDEIFVSSFLENPSGTKMLK